MTRLILACIASAMLWINTGNAQENTVSVESVAFLRAVSAFENKEYQSAVEQFTVLGKQGEPTSQHNLSILYFKGLGSPANYKLALYWAWRASLGGSEPALTLVDEIRGIVTENLIRNVSGEIVTELTAKAMAGNKNSSERLGKTYYSLFVKPDLKMAYIWFLISQAFGNENVSGFISEIEDQIEIKKRIAYQEEATEIFIKMPK